MNNSRKLKISYFTQNSMVSVDSKLVANNFPMHYFWFAKIISEKLLMKGFNFSQPYIPDRVKTNVNVKNQYIDGILYKKSQYLGKW